MFEKTKNFVKTHKKEIAIGACCIVGAVAIGLIFHQTMKGAKTAEKVAKGMLKEAPPPALDFGRDCIMKFFVEGTGEFLGEAACTETYVQDILEMTSQAVA